MTCPWRLSLLAPLAALASLQAAAGTAPSEDHHRLGVEVRDISHLAGKHQIQIIGAGAPRSSTTSVTAALNLAGVKAMHCLNFVEGKQGWTLDHDAILAVAEIMEHSITHYGFESEWLWPRMQGHDAEVRAKALRQRSPEEKRAELAAVQRECKASLERRLKLEPQVSDALLQERLTAINSFIEKHEIQAFFTWPFYQLLDDMVQLYPHTAVWYPKRSPKKFAQSFNRLYAGVNSKFFDFVFENNFLNFLDFIRYGQTAGNVWFAKLLTFTECEDMQLIEALWARQQLRIASVNDSETVGQRFCTPENTLESTGGRLQDCQMEVPAAAHFFEVSLQWSDALLHGMQAVGDAQIVEHDLDAGNYGWEEICRLIEVATGRLDCPRHLPFPKSHVAIFREYVQLVLLSILPQLMGLRIVGVVQLWMVVVPLLTVLANRVLRGRRGKKQQQVVENSP